MHAFMSLKIIKYAFKNFYFLLKNIKKLQTYVLLIIILTALSLSLPLNRKKQTF